MNSPNKYFEKAIPVWVYGREREMNLWLSFRTLAKGVQKTILRLTGSSAYQVKVNGTFIAFGPARCAHGFYRVDELDLSAYIKKQSVITVNVAGYNCASYYHLNQPSFLCAELIEDGEITAATGDDGFLCRVMTEHEQKAPRYSLQRTFSETYNLSELHNLWECAFSVNASDYAIVLPYPTEKKVFIERGSYYHTYETIPAEMIISRFSFEKADIPDTFRYPYYIRNATAASTYFPIREWETDTPLMTRALRPIDIQTTEESAKKAESLESGNAITYKMAINTTGLIAFDITCENASEILITFDEFAGEDGRVNYRRLNVTANFLWRFEKGSYHVSTFEPHTLGALCIHVLKGNVKLENVGMIYFGAKKIARRYHGSDQSLEKIFDAAVETYRQNTFTIYMDCPSRERAGWLCDSFFTARTEKTLTGTNEIERVFLENFFLPESFQNIPKGMFPMCYPADHISGSFIPNWAMWLVLELEEYLSRTADHAFIETAKPRIYELLRYFEGFENADGLLEKLESWVFVEWSEANKLTQDINFPTNMLYAKMLRAASRLYDDPSLSKKAECLKTVINEKAFMENGFYCDNAVYDKNGKATLSGKCTETCQYYAFFCEIATPEEKPLLWQRLLYDFGPERIVPGKWPEYTETAKWQEVYPSNAFIGNYLRLELLYLFGEHKKLIDNIKGYFTKMAELTGTLWENDSTSASCNHGFASHVVYWMDKLGMVE